MQLRASRRLDKSIYLSVLMLILILCGIVLTSTGIWAGSHSSVTISWQAGSQIDTLGFNLYRQGAGDNEFIRLNPYLITGNEDVLAPQTYSFQDTLPSGQGIYRYVIERISADGSAQRINPQILSNVGIPGWITWIGFIMLLIGLGILFTNKAWVRKAKSH